MQPAYVQKKMAVRERIVPSERRLATVGKENRRQLRVVLRGRRASEEAQAPHLGSESLLIALGT